MSETIDKSEVNKKILDEFKKMIVDAKFSPNMGKLSEFLRR